MPTYTPRHNTKALLIGNGEFSFALGALTVAQAAAQGYRDFGNIKAFQIEAGGEDKEHFGSYRGITRRDDMRRQKLKLGYKLTCDEWTRGLLRFLLFGKDAPALVRGAIAAVAGTAIPFSNGSPSRSMHLYDVLDAGGVRARDLVAVTFPGKVEGTDFEVDYKMGRVRFLTAQTAALTPTITAAAIVAGTSPSMVGIDPLTQNTFEGMGRLTVWDDDEGSDIVIEHTDFSCQIVIDGTPDVKTDDYSDLALKVTVTEQVGKFYSRND